MFVRTWIILTLWWYTVVAKIYQRCELARELKKLAVPQQEIPTWVCIAQHESLFDSGAMNMGSGDHGLFQISEIYWCSPPGYGCNKPCAAFRDDDISDDVECIRRIYNEHQILSGDGWNAWVVYPLYCKGDVAHYVQNCDLESVNVTSNEIPNEDKWEDQYGDGYQFPPLPSFNKKSESNKINNDGYVFPPLPNFVNTDGYGDGYQFPRLPILKADNSKNTLNNFKEDFEKFKDDYQFSQPELELSQKIDNKYNDGYEFPPLPTFGRDPEVIENKIKNQAGEKEHIDSTTTKSIKVQKFASKSTRRADSTTKSPMEKRFSSLGEVTTQKFSETSSTPKPFTFKLFSLTPFILNGQAVSINGETVTLKPDLTKLDTSDISLSESVKSYTATEKPNLNVVQSFTTPKTTTPELVTVVESFTNPPRALALQSLSQTKSKSTTERYRTWKPKTKSTKLYSSKFRTTKAPSTTEKSFIINTISAFVPKSSRKQYSTPGRFKVTTFKPVTTTTATSSTTSDLSEVSRKEAPSSTTTSTEVSTNETPSSTLKFSLSTFQHSSKVLTTTSSTDLQSEPLAFSNSNFLNDSFTNSTSKPFSFSTFAPLSDNSNSSLRQVTFPSYFPSWFQTLPPALAPLPPLPRPSSRKPWGALATRPTRRTTTSRPIRPLRPLFNQVTYKPPEVQTDTPLLRDILLKSNSQKTDSNTLFGSRDYVESSMYFENGEGRPSFSKSGIDFQSETKDTSDFLSDIFDIESRNTPEEELEEIILEPDYSFYRTKNGYRLFRRSPKKNT